MSGAKDIAWPLSPARLRLTRALATLLERDRGARFLRAPVVSNNKGDFPDPWEESAEGVGRLVARELWHAHLDLEATVEDQRLAERPGERGKTFRTSALHFDRLAGRRAVFAIEKLGNDDIAGLLAREVGRAYLAELARQGHPYRGAGAVDEDDDAGASLAAVALGLGVLTCNAAYHPRSADGGYTMTAGYRKVEHEINQAEGLAWQDLAFLVAVQATVRDDVLPGLDSLREPQVSEVAAWRKALDDHEDELVELLGLSRAASTTAPPRDAAPRVAEVSALPEEQRKQFNRGNRVYRVRGHKGTGFSVLGGVVGLAAAIPLVVLTGGAALAVGAGVGLVGGFAFGRTRRYYTCTDAECGFRTKGPHAVCPHCGGTIAAELRHADERLAKDEELDALEGKDPDKLLGPKPEA